MNLTIERFDQSQAPRVETYRSWAESQGIPVIKGFYVGDIRAVEVAPWEHKGGLGSLINLEGAGGTTDAYVCQIPPGEKLKPQKHLYEEMIYVATGHGATTVWQKEGKKHTFEWGPGSLFAVPLNAWYQHFNGSGSEPARHFAVTNAPFMMNLFHNVDFIFDSDFSFADRFDPGDEGYFGSQAKLYGRSWMSVNFIADTHTLALGEQSERGPGAKNMKFDLAGQIMAAHISEFAVGTYKKAHYHGPGAHVLILSGRGYSLLWPQGTNQRTKVEWGPGSLIVPPQLWFHQHLNAGAVPARYLALRWNNWRYPFVKMVEGSRRQSVKEGGTQLEYEDEDPKIHEEFEATLTEAGATCKMGKVHPFCAQQAS
jgi:oxalate decarboxylase/phosphoglucose isomerase-like protein (cupin superfamily)